jgi:hypothetical protein
VKDAFATTTPKRETDMKLFYTQACISSEMGTFAPWFIGSDIGSDAATKCGAAKSRAPRATTSVGLARSEPAAVRHGRGWSSVESIALSLFR